MALSGGSEVSILERLYPLLQQCLCVDEVRPFLVQNGTITLEQCQELQLGSELSTSTKVAEKAVLMLSRHPQCASQLLRALEATDSAKIPESSHHFIIDKLRAQLGHQTDDKDGTALQEDINQGASNEPVPFLNYKLLKEKKGLSEALRVKLAVESRRMLEHFTSFCICVGDLLQSKGVTTDRVRALLQYRLGSKNIGDFSMKQVTEARTIHNLLCAAEPFVSWFNYDLIAFLAKELGDREGMMVVADYEAKFQQYLQRLVFESPPFSAIKSIPSGFEELAVKLEWNFEEIIIQDITIFKGKLCEFLGHSDPSLFILKSVEEGCVVLTWLFPSSIVETALADISKNEVALLTVYPNIVYFRVGTKLFDQRAKSTESKLQFNSRLGPLLLTLHETESERTDSIDSAKSTSSFQESRLQVKQWPGSSKATSPLVSPTSEQVTTLSYKEVKLREKRKRRVNYKEYRKSSGYYSPSTSVYESPCPSQRSSLVLDLTEKRSSMHSSGYNSPGASIDQLDNDEECDQKQHCLEAHSTEASWSNPVHSESPMINNQNTAFTRQRSPDSDSSHS